MAADAPPAGEPIRPLQALLINVSTLLQEPIGALRRYRLESVPFATPPAVSPLSGDLKLLRTDQSLLATASLQLSIEDICGVCLQAVTLPLELDFDEEYWPGQDPFSGERIEAPPEREGFDVIDGQIDLSEAVRQYVEMSRPISPRCGAECPGMGADAAPLEPAGDQRWAALSALREQLSE